jgi:hypothetical protein
MNTEIKIQLTAGGDVTANTKRVPIASGDTISFTSAVAAALCMSSQTAQALSMPATSTRVEVTPKKGASFTFGSPPPGEYWIMVTAPKHHCEREIKDYLGGTAAVLRIGFEENGWESGPSDETRPVQ